MIKKSCETCKKEFLAPQNSRRFCSSQCAGVYHSVYMKKKSVKKYSICPICKKQFRKYRTNIFFCSNKCRHKNHSNKMKGKQPHWLRDKAFKKGMTPWNKGMTGLKFHYKTPFIKGHKFNLREKSPCWKGGKRKTFGGYIEIADPNTPRDKAIKYIREHRYIIEQFLGRKLKSEEYIHHKNGIKHDNRIENLEIVLRTCHKGKIICPHCQKSFSIK